jgi:hypothetical protein
MHKTMKHQLCIKVAVLTSCLRVTSLVGVSSSYFLTEWVKLTSPNTAPNDNIYCTATSLSGPWSAWADFATAGTNTFSSQTAAVVSINGVVMYSQTYSVSNSLN